jgi:hypothetical protein
MSERTVTVTIKVDPAKYNFAEDTDEGAVTLVADMLRNGADLPEDAAFLRCGSIEKALANIPENDEMEDFE